jgi:hypothetical protein
VITHSLTHSLTHSFIDSFIDSLTHSLTISLYLARQEAAALRIQTVIRRVLAVKYVKEKSRRIWQRVFDPRFKLYFWYNKANGQSQWIVPKNLDLFTDVDEKAACILQRYIRGFVGKMRAKKVVYRYPLTHSSIHSLTYLLTHSLTHSKYLHPFL